mgnify:CR=1 FL=1
MLEQKVVIEASIDELSSAMRTVGFLEGLSSFLWTKCDQPDGLSSEVCGLYDELVDDLLDLIAAAKLGVAPRGELASCGLAAVRAVAEEAAGE